MSDEDYQLFRASVGAVTPVRHDRTHLPAARPAPQPLRQAAEHLSWEDLFTDSDTPLGPSDILEFQRPGLQHRVLAQLRQGRWPVDASLDLHGQTVAQARQHLLKFLGWALQRELRCLHIIHGKGYRSPEQQPRLKTQVAHWLRQCPQVLAYVSATPRDGGVGAVYVLIKSR